MKKTLTLLLFYCAFFVVHRASGQAGEWVWLHGDSTFAGTGNFGTQGVPSPLNEPPHLYECCEWTDLNGNFWMYGGLDDNAGIQIHNDLWKYDPLTNEWTWMSGTNTLGDQGNFGVQGIPSPANRPPGLGYGAASWVDLNGDLWMFAGWNDSSYCDLWRYNIAANEWTWMKGPGIGNQNGIYGQKGVPDPGNNPGARSECATAWTDNAGDLWVFGGEFGPLFNDLWRFNIASNTWTWMKGDTASQLGVWGTMGVENPLNTPSGRWCYARWTDYSGNLWLFGGQGFDATGGNWYMNDMWRYNPVTNNWAWMNGSQIGNTNGVYGSLCVSSPANVPPHRFENRAAWTDAGGSFWMFGGTYRPGLFTIAGLNDLWMYCVNSNEWTWEAGDSVPNLPGLWGTKGVSAPTNKPADRNGAVAWRDNSGHLYFFGGTDASFGNLYNDLWMYTIDPVCTSTCISLPVASFTAPHHVCPGTCTDFTNLSFNATGYQWTFAGATPSASTDVNPTGICYNTPGSYDVSLIATNASGSDTLTLNNYIIVYPYPPPQGIIQSSDTLFANTGAVSYQWYLNSNLIAGATDYFYVASQNGDYNVVATDVNGCEVEAVIYDVIARIPFPEPKDQISIFPNPVGDKLELIIPSTTLMKLASPGDFPAGGISVYNPIGELVLVVPLPTANCTLPTCIIDVSQLPSAMYYLEINTGDKTLRAKIMKK